MDGMIKLATTTKNKVLPPASFLRKARPANTDKTTVNAITISPTLNERLSAAPMSTEPRPCANLWNQCVDTPRKGKVKPPSGPWKLKITMTSIGPYKNST